MMSRTDHPNYDRDTVNREGVIPRIPEPPSAVIIPLPPKQKACWNCGGSGNRCCEYAADMPKDVWPDLGPRR